MTVTCGQTTCGQDSNTYLCSSGGWSFDVSGCSGGAFTDAAASCSCSGVGSAGPVTVTCGQTTCGQDSNTYLCSSGGWSFDVSGCSGGASDAAASCSCSGVGMSGPVTVTCGQTTCGEDDNTYLCNAPGGANWSFATAGCGE